MAIPSGSGTEVLKRVYKHAQTDTWTSLITGVANHIYTVLSVTFCEQAGAAEQINMVVNIDAGGTTIGILERADVPAYGTFIFSDKFVMSGTDILKIYQQSAGNTDIYLSYIDQDWT